MSPFKIGRAAAERASRGRCRSTDEGAARCANDQRCKAEACPPRPRRSSALAGATHRFHARALARGQRVQASFVRCGARPSLRGSGIQRVLQYARGRCCRLAALAAPDQRRADVIVVVGDLAVQAIEAFIHVDDATGLDRADRTDGLAMVAAAAAFRTAVEPIEYADAAEDGETTTERASKTAIEALDEHAG